MPLECLWEEEKELCQSIKNTMKLQINKTFKSLLIPLKFTPICNSDPYLHGYWGDVDLYTISTQSIEIL